MARLQIPDLDAAVRAAGHDTGFVELQAGDAVVVRGEAVDGRLVVERPDAHGAVGAAGDEDVAAHLELADEGGVALEDGFALAVWGGWLGKGACCGLNDDWKKELGLKEWAYPVSGSQIRTLVSRLPVAILFPSKAMA